MSTDWLFWAAGALWLLMAVLSLRAMMALPLLPPAMGRRPR